MRRGVLGFTLTALLAAAGTAPAQTNPFDGLNAGGRALRDPAVYEQQKAQWLARLQLMPDNVDVLEGAADFFIIRERTLAQQFIERASTLEPNEPRWHSRLAQIHKLNADRDDDPAEARLALRELERARDLTPLAKRELPLDLAEAAFRAGDFVKARTYAEHLLAAAVSQPRNWAYGNAVHKGNLVLGRLAVREGRIEDAISFLRRSGETPGSPQLDSFGPNMSLARDLIERGETEAVLAYFAACRVFWKMGADRLDQWASLVSAGQVPNFGANLVY
jgi:tetratricopeptide (TPR) repeat protein